MLITMLRGKLHHARVTAADINYVGSITIDTAILEQAGMVPYEQVLVVDVENGSRFETYIIPGAAHSGAIEVNGAAAHLVSLGDRLIIMAFGMIEAPVPSDWSPTVIVLNEQNAIDTIQHGEAVSHR